MKPILTPGESAELDRQSRDRGVTVEALMEILPYITEVNVMTVEPGFGGQRFIKGSPDKVRRLRSLAPDIEIEVDGGIDVETGPLCVAAGANVLVAGSAVFGHSDGVGAGVRRGGTGAERGGRLVPGAGHGGAAGDHPACG